jgi:tyrosinase
MGGGCVSNGPFQNWTINVGPGQSTALNTRCLKRGLNPDTVQWLRPERGGRAMLAGNFTEFDARAQAPPDVTPETTIRMMHAAGHYVTGGEAMDYISSTSGVLKFIVFSPLYADLVIEALFWLHHAYLDKVYSSWQAINLAKRLYDIGGPSLPLSPESP